MRKGRDEREALQHARAQIVRIQAGIRMVLARRHYQALKAATKCAFGLR